MRPGEANGFSGGMETGWNGTHQLANARRAVEQIYAVNRAQHFTALDTGALFCRPSLNKRSHEEPGPVFRPEQFDADRSQRLPNNVPGQSHFATEKLL
mgnify:FL=1|jgi:hypothetical protein